MKHVLWHIIMIILILSVAGSVSAVEITAETEQLLQAMYQKSAH